MYVEFMEQEFSNNATLIITYTCTTIQRLTLLPVN